MLIAPLPTAADDAADRIREHERQNPERTTPLLAAAGAAVVLGARHSATRAFAKASITMARVDLWRARLALKTLRKDQREAIAEVAETSMASSAARMTRQCSSSHGRRGPKALGNRRSGRAGEPPESVGKPCR
jgi:hypothetical protein